MLKTINIFKAGPVIDSNGIAREFSKQAVQQMADTFDAKILRVPLLIGHEQGDATPAYGWVQKLWTDNTDGEFRLFAEVHCDENILVALNKTVPEYKNVSASFYLPDSNINPNPNQYTLRHIALVTTPAVKGLLEFAEKIDMNFMEFVTLELLTKPTSDTASPDETPVTSMGVDVEGEDDADGLDNTLSEEELLELVLQELNIEKKEEAEATVVAVIGAESQNQIIAPMVNNLAITPAHEDNQDVSDLAESNGVISELQAEIALMRKQLHEQKQDTKKKEIAQFVESVYSECKLTPAQIAPQLLTQFAHSLSDESGTASFCDGYTGMPESSMLDLFKQFLMQLPAQYQVQQMAQQPAKPINIDANDDDDDDLRQWSNYGYDFDPQAKELHKKAMAYVKKHGVDYATAVTKVSV